MERSFIPKIIVNNDFIFYHIKKIKLVFLPLFFLIYRKSIEIYKSIDV